MHTITYITTSRITLRNTDGPENLQANMYPLIDVKGDGLSALKVVNERMRDSFKDTQDQ
jgi:hypothetical protein